jgi:hypothetical protein
MLRAEELVRSRDNELKSALEKYTSLQVALAKAQQNEQSVEQRVVAAQGEITRLNELVNDTNAAAAAREVQLNNRTEQALSEMRAAQEREQGIRVELARAEQRLHELNATLERTRHDVEREKSLAAQREQELKNDFAQKTAALTGVVTRLENEIAVNERAAATQLEAANALRIDLMKQEQKQQDLISQVSRLETDLAAARASIVEREQGMRAAISQQESLKSELASVARQLRDTDAARPGLQHETAAHKSILAEREYQMKQQSAVFDTERKKYEDAVVVATRAAQEAKLFGQLQQDNLKKEIERLSAAVAVSQQTIAAAKQEYAAREQDVIIQAKHREASMHSEIVRLQDNVQKMEQAFADAQRQHQQLSLAQEQRLSMREAGLISERDAIKDLFVGLKTDNETLRRDSEKTQAELNNAQRRVDETKELYERSLRAREDELAQLKAGRLSFEDGLRRQLSDEYRHHIERLEHEKQDAERALLAQIQGLRETMRADLHRAEETVVRERLDLERMMDQKESSLRELQRALKNAEGRLEEQKLEHEKSMLALRAEYREEITQLDNERKELSVEMRKQAQNEVRVVKPAEQFHDDTMIMEPKQQQPARPRKALFGRIWENLNEPIIEIGGADKDEHSHE